MLRKVFLFLVLICAATTGLQNAAEAQVETLLAPEDQILRTLLSHGYTIVENERTWLGRQRILAEKDGLQREVVFVPGTGEILRDYSAQAPALASGALPDAGQDHGAEGSLSDDRSAVSGAANGTPTVAANPSANSTHPSTPPSADIGILP